MNETEAAKGQGRRILVTSGSGGVGKTAFAAGLGMALAKAGRRVICIDLTAGIGNLDLRMGMSQSAIFSVRDIFENKVPLRDCAVRVTGFDTLYLLGTPAPGYVPPADKLRTMAHQICNEDWDVIFDCPTGINDTVKAAANACDLGFLLCPVAEDTLRVAMTESDCLAEWGELSLRMVAARVPTDKKAQKQLTVTVDDCMDACGLPLGAIFYEDPAVAGAAADMTALKNNKRSPAVQELDALAERIIGKIF